jgi:ABC-type sugar transport system ATPase subunit
VEIYSGEVHALMGENGAGKSTLMNIIAGSFDDYTGEIFVNGKKALLHSPARAKAYGIEMVHQELSLAQPLTIAENLFIGHLPHRGFFLDRKSLGKQSRELLSKVALDLNPWMLVENLSQHEAQLVEIAKALGSEPSILIMDEPTSSLSRVEVERLFKIIRQLKKENLAILYISHHLPEIFEAADRVSVLRDAKKIETQLIGNLTSEKLVSMMVGVSQNKSIHRSKKEASSERLRVENFNRYGFFHHANFAIQKGEILGIAGLAGAGRSEIARSLCAIDPLDEGRLFLNNEEIFPMNYREAMQYGLAYLSEDRKLEGLALELELDLNMLIALNTQNDALIPTQATSKVFHQQAKELQLHPSNPEAVAKQLSGGNQQKVLLGKWLAIRPEVLILDEPTRGVDIGAKQLIHEAIDRLATSGTSVLLISSDLPEMVALADRVIVLRKGHLVQEIKRGDFTENTLLLAMNGET